MFRILLLAPTIKIIFVHIFLFRCPVYMFPYSWGKVEFDSNLPQGPVVEDLLDFGGTRQMIGTGLNLYH